MFGPFMNRLILQLSVSFFVLLFGCSNLSKNFVKKGEFSIDGGSYKGSSWDEPLYFDRFSWHQELTLMYDLMLTRLDNKSPYNKWFSSKEMELVDSCHDFYIAISYALDAKKISTGMLLDQVKRYGYQQVLIPNFEKNVMLHPNYEKSALKLYEIYGLCRKTSLDKSVAPTVLFPNFEEIVLP